MKSFETKSSFCTTCPRNCHVDRMTQKGFCNENEKIKIAKIIENFMWEEPCVTGKKGCLAIFFSGCNLRCSYCQNFDISRGGVGKEYSIDEFASLIEKHQKNHSSIDLITPTHFSRQIAMAFEKVDKKIPIVWNTNGYETEENIDFVSKFVDVFLTDFKYANNDLGQKLSKCKDYFSKTLLSTKRMCKNKPDIMKDGFMHQGVVIRHLVLPLHVKNSIAVLDILSKEFKDRMVSIMSQFTPNGKDELSRKITPIEYKAVLSHLEKVGIKSGYIQDFESACESFVPDFEQNS